MYDSGLKVGSIIKYWVREPDSRVLQHRERNRHPCDVRSFYPCPSARNVERGLCVGLDKPCFLRRNG